MFEFIVAARYVWSARRQAHTAFLASISTLGIAVGVATLLISLALLSGLQNKIKDRLMAESPQLLIEPAKGNRVAGIDEIRSIVSNRGAARMREIVSGIAWAADPGGREGSPAQIESWSPEDEPQAEEAFGRKWEAAVDQSARSAFVTRRLATSLGLFLGDEMILVSPRTRLTPFGPVPVWQKFVITRIVPPSENGAEIRLRFDDAAILFGTDGKPSSLALYGPADEVGAIREEIQTRVPDLLIRDWKEINRPLFLALRLEKIVMFATISLIVLVAALNLISSISMFVVEKRPQIGVLRTMGSSSTSILRIFLGVGLMMGLAGTILGNLIGLGFSWASETWGLVPLPRDIYLADHLPFAIEASDVLIVNLIAVLLSIGAAWYPARSASQLDPIAAIREE